MKKTFQNVLFWSIISAAFIGPGTVTTASNAGASFGLALLWALLFSTLATVVLQEAAARITIASGKNLGEIIAIKYQKKSGAGLKWGIFLAVAFGCAAYQAGNMLGAISGISLVFDWSPKWMTVILGVVCAVILWVGNLKIIAKLLGFIVAFMGISFVFVALKTDVSTTDFFKNMFIPSMPTGSSLLIIGLIGTTIVPYNLFLASGISPGQEIKEMRQGIGLAVIIGGIISMAILVVGTQVSGDFSFAALADTLDKNLGNSGKLFLGFGLFAAGFSSSITSPLAAAVTAKSLFGTAGNWSVAGKKFKLVWGIILLIGLAFGVSEVKPIPAIILAQAINGALLPLVTIFLILVVNDPQILPKKYLNSHFLNILMLLIVGITGFLGTNNLLKALTNIFDNLKTIQFEIAFGTAVLLVLGLSWKIWIKNNK